MAEKIKHQKSNNEIKNDLIDLKLRSYKVDDKSQDEGKLISKSFGNENSLLFGKKLPFFFSEYLRQRKFIHNSDDNMSDYFKTIIHDVRIALDIPEVLQTLEDYIDVLDRPETDNKKILLPRYK